MNSLPATVGDFYQYVVGVDTHAATHSYAIIEAPNGGLIDQNAFPTSPAGLRRAREWITRRTEGDLGGVFFLTYHPLAETPAADEFLGRTSACLA